MNNINLSKNYTIYTGQNIWSLVLKYVGMDLLLGLFATYFVLNSDFLLTKNSMLVSVLFISAGAFSTIHTNVRLTAGKADCYLMTLNDRRKIYFSTYFVTYFTMLVAMLVLVALFYFKAAFYHKLPENPSLCFLLDMECILLYFALLPFTFKNKTLKGVWPKNLLVFLLYCVASSLCGVKPMLIVAIVLVLAVPAIGVWSNKRWIKLISEVM